MQGGAGRVFPVLCLLGAFFFLVHHASALGAENRLAGSEQIDRLVRHGGFIVCKDGKIAGSRNPDTLLVPASIWKIATGLEALHLFGRAHRFQTFFYQDQKGNLYIRGTGDPFLVSEEVALAAAGLKNEGLGPVRDIILDDSFYALAHSADGAGLSLNPYDVSNSALAVNFNTVNIEVSTRGTVTSAEPQTPTLPLMKRLGRKLDPGVHRINISQDPVNVRQYAGELFRFFLTAQGIPVQGNFRAGRVPNSLAPLYRHASTRKMYEMLRGMMRYSNNFIANQLFLACGARKFGAPATWAKGKRAMEDFLTRRAGLAAESFRVEEGSGLSRGNRITPRAMMRLLERFRPYADLLPSVKGGLVKSGTLTGVYSYAGYLERSGRLDSFVLVLNQPENTRDALLRILENL